MSTASDLAICPRDTPSSLPSSLVFLPRQRWNRRADPIAGWQIFNAILGWTNTATLGTILAYVFYWILIIVTLIYLKWEEGRVSFCGFKSAAGKQRDLGMDHDHVEGMGSASGNVSRVESGEKVEETPSREKNMVVE